MQKAKIIKYNSEEELENARAMEASQTSYTERFYTLMKLIKVSKMISKPKLSIPLLSLISNKRWMFLTKTYYHYGIASIKTK